MTTLPDTYWTTEQELLLFGGACLLGLPAGILLDFWRVLRRVKPHHPAAAAVEDVLWILSTAVLLLGYAAVFAKGVFRLYFAVGCGIGLVLYEVTLGSRIVCACAKLCNILLLPVGRIGAAFALICKKQTCRFVKYSEKKRPESENPQNPLQEHGRMVYNNVRRTGKKGKTKWQQKE